MGTKPPNILDLERRLKEHPDDVQLLHQLADAHEDSGRMLPALRAYDRIIEMGSASAHTWCSTGNALSAIGEFAQAIGAYREGLALDPTHMEAHHNLARALYKLGEVDAAISELETVLGDTPFEHTLSGLATIIPCGPTVTQQRILEVRRACGKQSAPQSLGPSAAHNLDPRPTEKIRIGYVSAHFGKANYMKPVWGLLNRHDRSTFEVYVFCDDASETAMSWFKPTKGDRVFTTASLDNATLAQLIKSTQVDILVDLSAYSAPARLGLFHQRLAPVTAAWFNMYATSGLPEIDYIVGDDQVVRTDEKAYYTEKVIRLPLSYLTFEVNHPAPPVSPPPCLTRGHLTFGSLVSQCKITPPVLDAWAAILRAAKDTRLALGNAELKSRCNQQFIEEAFAARGILPERLTFLAPASHYDFLAYYNQMDIALDAFPYNGGTTTMEAIWQGVPVLTFDGDRWASRTSKSILYYTHLREWIARDVAEFIHMGINWANDANAPEKLTALRADMRTDLSDSLSCNMDALTTAMEKIYTEIHRPRRKEDEQRDGEPNET